MHAVHAPALDAPLCTLRSAVSVVHAIHFLHCWATLLKVGKANLQGGL